MNLTKYERRPSREVRIGRVVIGGNRPIAVQSMTNTDTKDTEACVKRAISDVIRSLKNSLKSDYHWHFRNV